MLKINTKTNSLNQVIEKFTSRRLWNTLPFILGFIVLGFIIWTGIRTITYPHDGIGDLHPTGRIGELDQDGPAASKLAINDLIVSVDGIPWEKALFFYVGKKGGDLVQFVVNRDGTHVPVTIKLIDPPFSEVLIRLVPLFVAFIFWAVGMGVLTFKPSESSADIFIVWCQTSALTLSAGVSSYLGPLWASGLFNILLWFIGPISVHLHLFFPQAAPLKLRQFIIPILYAIAIIGTLPYLTFGFRGVRTLAFYSSFLASVRVFLAVNLLLVVALLYYNYRNPILPGTRGKIRIVALGGGLTAIPIVCLTILPDAVLHQPIIIYPLAFLLLSILPLTYGYTIFRLHLIEIEKHVNRGATFIIVYSILAGFYLIFYALFQYFLPARFSGAPIISTVLVLILATLFIPLRTRVQKFVDTVFYGGWYDIRTGITETTGGLEQYLDLQSLAKTVSRRLVNTLRLEEACVFLRDAIGDFSVIEVFTRSELTTNVQVEYPVLPRTSLTYLLRIGAAERTSLRKTLAEVTLSPEELQLLNTEQIHLWVPVVGHGQILGLLALGPKLGGDVFSGEDLDILRILARQMGPVIENLHLVTQLRTHAAQLEERVNERTAQLYDAKERVEAILSSVGEGVYVTDLKGSIITVNAAFERQSGYEAIDLINQDHRELIQDYNDPAIIEDMEKKLASGEIWSGELLHRRKDGSAYDVQLTIAPVRGQDRDIVSYVGSQRDITRQKELDRLKDMFVSDVSHELRTPTTNIRLYLEMLEDAPQEKKGKYLSVIKEQSYLLTKLVEDILDLSRLSMSKIKKVELEDVNINLLAEQAITAYQPLASASGLDIVFEPTDDIPLVRGDQNQMSRVITNLVSNAVRYTAKGEICVQTFQSNGHVYLIVKDTGIGITPEDLPHIFDRFYRGSYIRQSKIHGTGLGLAIVKEIVEQHHGSVEVTSEVGIGSIFKISLPVQ